MNSISISERQTYGKKINTMKTLSWITLLAGLFFTTMAQAQRDETLFNNHNAWLSGVWGSATVNYSSFKEDWALVRGGYGGLEFGKIFLLGWGGYRSKEFIQLENPDDGFELKYNGMIFGVTPMSQKVIHPKITLLTGRGKIDINNTGYDRVFVLQPSAGFEVNVFTWFHLGLEGGYRMISGVNYGSIGNGDVSSPFAQLDLKFGVTWGR